MQQNEAKYAALIDQAKKIIARNPKAIIAGSLALSLHGIHLRREVKDIDFHVPNGESIDTSFLKIYAKEIKEIPAEHAMIPVPPANFAEAKKNKKSKPQDEDEYEGVEGMECLQFVTEAGIRVDFFRPDRPNDYEFMPKEIEGLQVAPLYYLLGVKARTVFRADQTNKDKHGLDIVFMISNNL